MSVPSELANWIPSRLWRHQGQPAVTWVELGTERFDRPFFHETLDAALARPGAPAPRHTGLDALIEEARRAQAAEESLAPPSGLIFHMSRCGSTLVSSTLAQEPSALVLGEPNPLGDYFEIAQALPPQRRGALLRALLILLGRRRSGETQFTIKAMSQLAVFLPFLLQTLPQARWIFVYRDPLEVLVSLIEGESFVAGLHARPKLAAHWAGIPAAEVAALPPEVFAARMLGRICATAAGAGDRGGGGARARSDAGAGLSLAGGGADRARRPLPRHRDERGGAAGGA
ncbi:MAG: hypothetical protein WDZ84_12185 [Rhodovibrionaceae bacterium]